MTTQLPKVAETVRTSGSWGMPSVVFDVDGKDFPWFMPDQCPPRIVRLLDDWYSVTIDILCIPKGADGKPIPNTPFPVRTDGYNGRRLFLDGVEFPWVLGEDGYVIKSCRTECQTVQLTFMARHLDHDMDNLCIEDRREIMDIGGNLWASEIQAGNNVRASS